jgi:hypothetical protein
MKRSGGTYVEAQQSRRGTAIRVITMEGGIHDAKTHLMQQEKKGFYLWSQDKAKPQIAATTKLTILRRFIMKLQSILFIALFSLGASTALAQNVGFVYWQANGGGCVPTDATIQNQQYFSVTAAGRVKYKGDGTKPLVFSCSVTSFNPNVTAGDGTILRLFYQDPDGPEGDFKVEARLMSFAKSNGALTEVSKVTSDKTGQWQESKSRVGSNIDMNANLYWVEVVIRRTKASKLVVEFNGVSLEGVIF